VTPIGGEGGRVGGEVAAGRDRRRYHRIHVHVPGLKKLERATGFEPATYGLGSRRSTPELHPLDGHSSQEAARVQSSSRSFHRAVEYDPDGEIVGEVLKPVRRISPSEAKVATPRPRE